MSTNAMTFKMTEIWRAGRAELSVVVVGWFEACSAGDFLERLIDARSELRLYAITGPLSYFAVTIPTKPVSEKTGPPEFP
jgi:hypothetical protein